jgi:hypothetical protein
LPTMERIIDIPNALFTFTPDEVESFRSRLGTDHHLSDRLLLRNPQFNASDIADLMKVADYPMQKALARVGRKLAKEHRLLNGIWPRVPVKIVK